MLASNLFDGKTQNTDLRYARVGKRFYEQPLRDNFFLTVEIKKIIKIILI